MAGRAGALLGVAAPATGTVPPPAGLPAALGGADAAALAGAAAPLEGAAARVAVAVLAGAAAVPDGAVVGVGDAPQAASSAVLPARLAPNAAARRSARRVRRGLSDEAKRRLPVREYCMRCSSLRVTRICARTRHRHCTDVSGGGPIHLSSLDKIPARWLL